MRDTAPRASDECLSLCATPQNDTIIGQDSIQDGACEPTASEGRERERGGGATPSRELADVKSHVPAWSVWCGARGVQGCHPHVCERDAKPKPDICRYVERNVLRKGHFNGAARKCRYQPPPLIPTAVARNIKPYYIQLRSCYRRLRIARRRGTRE